jgi:hypothetical protein
VHSGTCLLGCAMLAAAVPCAAQEFHPTIPKAWDEKAVEGFEVPLAQRDRTPRHLTVEQYHALKVRTIYRSYPMYVKGREPKGYLESLKQKEPEIVFDPSKLHTKEDWIQAGKIVFDADILFRPAPETQPAAGETPWPVSSDGGLAEFVPGYRYFIRKKGVLEVGINSCAGCHTRIMPDGSIFEGGQGMPNSPSPQARIRNLADLTPEVMRRRVETWWINFGAPWVMDREAYAQTVTRELVTQVFAAARPSVLARQGTSQTHPVHVPSLVGIGDLKYLDATGLVRNRSIGDLMRYAITNQGLDTMAHYGDFQPSPAATIFSGDAGMRYSDEQLYALGLYLESLKPPPNPNPLDERARRGQKIFQEQGCSGCHMPPLYTNNKLTPAKGFKVPDDLLKTDDILNVSVGTDPTLALQTRRGTGFYKVPSLRGVWYRTAFGHGGWADSLEEWLDPARLKEDYVPKGFHLGPGPIQGHEFGLKLAPEDKGALIAFLKTL